MLWQDMQTLHSSVSKTREAVKQRGCQLAASVSPSRRCYSSKVVTKVVAFSIDGYARDVVEHVLETQATCLK